MKYFLDSVLKKDMEKWFPMVEGVTSNPILLERANMEIDEFLENVASVEGGLDKKVFVQVTSMAEVKKVKEAWLQKMTIPVEGMRMVKTNPNDNLIFKVTMHPKFYDLIHELKNGEYRYNVAATTMYDIVQINQAVEFGCDYSMVYKYKNENPNLFVEASRLKQVSRSDIKLVGASFRGKQEVCEAILSGMDYATVSPSALEQTFKNAQLKADFHDLYE